MSDKEELNSDLTVIGLLFFLLISFGIQVKTSYYINKLEKEIILTTNIIYYVSDRLDIAHNMIESLNEEQRIMQYEINEMKKVQRITKELR